MAKKTLGSGYNSFEIFILLMSFGSKSSQDSFLAYSIILSIDITYPLFGKNSTIKRKINCLTFRYPYPLLMHLLFQLLRTKIYFNLLSPTYITEIILHSYHYILYVVIQIKSHSITIRTLVWSWVLSHQYFQNTSNKSSCYIISLNVFSFEK